MKFLSKGRLYENPEGKDGAGN